MLFLFRNIEDKILLTPPPSPQKWRIDTNVRDMATRTYVCLYQQPVTWICTMSTLSDPYIENYYLIIVVFSRPHFIIYGIFFYKENTRISNVIVTLR